MPKAGASAWISLTSASNAALIVASYPAITALLERLIYKSPISLIQAAGIATAMAGVAILTGAQESPKGSHEFWGNCLLLCSGFVWAFYTFAARKVVGKYSGTTFAFYQTTAGTLFFLPLALLEAGQWRMPTAEATLALAHLAFICSVGAFMLYNYGLRGLSPSAAVSAMNLVPVFGVICSVVVLGESVGLRQMLGGLIVIFGVTLSLRAPKKSSSPGSPP